MLYERGRCAIKRCTVREDGFSCGGDFRRQAIPGTSGGDGKRPIANCSTARRGHSQRRRRLRAETPTRRDVGQRSQFVGQVPRRWQSHTDFTLWNERTQLEAESVITVRGGRNPVAMGASGKCNSAAHSRRANGLQAGR